MKTFSELGISPELLQAIEEMGFTAPTPIQEETIPILLAGENDYIGLAQTGTGKTAAFGLPIIDLTDVNNAFIQGLILAPTRELGKQIATQLQKMAKYKQGIKVQVVYGGAAITNQIDNLKKKPQILIATPGRLKDLIQRKKVNLSQVSCVVLDEADEMMSMGFKEDLDDILSYTPDEKKTWLFSATMPKEIRKIIEKFMNNPMEVKVNTKNEVNENITHKFVVLKTSDKTEAVKRFLDTSPDMSGIIFCRTRRETQALAEHLMAAGYKADAIHGDLSQSQRERVMGRFKKHALNLLVATDVAARGIDVDNLTHVFHFTLPDELAYYTHRSGRTGRAGNKGVSIAFVHKGGLKRVKELERMLKIEFEKLLVPNSDEVLKQRMQIWTDKILKSEINEYQEEVVNAILPRFDNMTKEELIAKLVGLEINKFGKTSGGKDLNKSAENDNSRPPRTGMGGGKKRGRDKKRGSRDRGSRDRDRGGRDGDRRENRNSRSRFDSKDRGNNRNKYEDRGKSDRKTERRKPSGDGTRFFINLGEMDKINKADLIKFISKNGKVNQKSISDVTVQGKHSYFSVNKDDIKGFADKFEGIKVGKRDLRVNRDN